MLMSIVAQWHATQVQDYLCQSQWTLSSVTEMDEEDTPLQQVITSGTNVYEMFFIIILYNQ